MKARTTIFSNTQGTEELRSALGARGILFNDLIEFQQAMRDGLVIDDNPELEHGVIDILAGMGRQPSVLREFVYSRREVENATLASITMRLPPRGDANADMDTVYDIASGCAACGAGATQVSALRLCTRDLPKRADAFRTLSRHILLSQRVRDMLIHAVPSVQAHLSQAEEAWTHEALPWWQIRPRISLPPFASQTSGVVREKPCRCCGRDGYFHSGEKPFQLAYDQSQVTSSFGDASSNGVASLPPFMATFECFGNSTVSTPASPHIVARNDVIRCLLSARIRGLDLLPVSLAPP
jgi:hypothetical protein